jgi:acyl-CoA dehydrogenase
MRDRMPRSPAPRPRLAQDTVGPFLDESHRVLADRLASFVAEAVATLPPADDDDAARVAAREILALLGRGGWLLPIGGGADGGSSKGPRSPDLRACALTREGLAHGSPLADAVFALQALGAAPVLLFGTPAQRERWAEPALRGEAMAAFAMTEAEVGSDVASIRTVARREDDGYVLDGEKTFISNAGIADFYAVFASTDPEAGGKGLSCFVVPADAPGFVYRGPLRLSEPHPLGTIAFERCRIPADHRIGEEGAGLRIGLTVLDRLRPTVAAAACGMAARALDEALAHAAGRRQFGRPLADFQLVQEKLARMATELEAARLLTHRAAWLHDTGRERITLEAAQAKAFATEAAQRVVDDAVQILGGRGVLADHPVDRLYRAVRALRIYEGTTEIQHLVIARQLLEAASRGRGSDAEPDEGPDSEPGEAR